jgi:hypothetical protein
MHRETKKYLQEVFLKKFDLGESIPENMEYDWDWAWDRYYFESACYIGEFKSQKNVKNFVYDRHLELVFINFEAGYHSAWMGFLQSLYDKMGRDDMRKWFDGHFDLSDKFIQERKGFYLSSVSDGIYKLPEMALTAQEKMVFKQYHFYKF